MVSLSTHGHRWWRQKLKEQEMELRQMLDLTPQYLAYLELMEAQCMPIEHHLITLA
jgi:hypothetical protein